MTIQYQCKILCSCFLGAVFATTIFVWLVLGWLWLLPIILRYREGYVHIVEESDIKQMVFEDGTVYNGTIHNELPDGMGTAVQVDGTVYDG